MDKSLHKMAAERQARLEVEARRLLERAETAHTFDVPGFTGEIRKQAEEAYDRFRLTMDELKVVDQLLARRWERLKNWFAVFALVLSIISLAVTATMLVLRVREVRRNEIPMATQPTPVAP